MVRTEHAPRARGRKVKAVSEKTGSPREGASGPLSRAARIVDAVAVSRNGLSQQQIGNIVGLAPSTTYRLVRSLLAIGYIAFNSDRKTYQLGRRITRLFQMRLGAETIQPLVEPILRELVQEFDQVCYLTQLRDEEVRLVAFSMPENANRALIYPGETSLIHAMATGKATFAFQDSDLIERHLARPLAKLQANTKTDPADIRRELALVRRQGYAVTDSEFEEGVFAVSCPVNDPETGVVFALGMAGFKSQLFEHHTLADYVKGLQCAADQVAKILKHADHSTPK
jgi:IclR family acetate operon transcriptional repressor